MIWYITPRQRQNPAAGDLWHLVVTGSDLHGYFTAAPPGHPGFESAKAAENDRESRQMAEDYIAKYWTFGDTICNHREP